MATKTLKKRAEAIREGLKEKEMTIDKNLKDKEIIGPTESRLGDKRRERKTDKSKTNVTIGDRKMKRE
jgi:hypothetical protein